MSKPAKTKRRSINKTKDNRFALCNQRESLQATRGKG
jgi:hypothetical protein